MQNQYIKTADYADNRRYLEYYLRKSGTPRGVYKSGVYKSVGEIPTRQLAIRTVVKGEHKS